jgi:hypothetical protein
MFQSLASQPVSNLGQCCLFTFRKQQPTLDLTSEDPVLCRQLLVPQQEFQQQEFLIDHSSEIGQHARPDHFQSLPKLNLRTRIVHAFEVSESSCARKLRYRKPSLFNAFEIFDHTPLNDLTETVPIRERVLGS